jgi:hypothetical protein
MTISMVVYSHFDHERSPGPRGIRSLRLIPSPSHRTKHFHSNLNLSPSSHLGISNERSMFSDVPSHFLACVSILVACVLLFLRSVELSYDISGRL